MAVTEQDINTALQTVVDPLTGQDFVAAKAIKNMQIQAGAVSFDLVLGYPAKSLWASFQQQLEHVVGQLPGVSSVRVHVSSQVVAHAAQPGVALLPQVKNIIAVASGKGGVGKSTTAANLALAALPGFTLPGDTSASARYFARDVTTPFVLRDGHLDVPTGPGIGVEPDLDMLDSITDRVERVDSFSAAH